MEFNTPPESEKILVGPADLWEMKRQFQITFLIEQGLKPGHTLLDFGCGNLRGGLPLIYMLDAENYTGTDVRQEVIEVAKKEMQTHLLEEKFPKLLVFPREWHKVEDQTFDYIWAFSVLFHIANTELQTILPKLRRCAGPGTQFLANVQIGPNQESTWREFPFVQREWEWYEDVFFKSGWTIQDMGPMIQFGHVHPRLSKEEQERQRFLKGTPL